VQDTILIVEDHPAVRASLRAWLEIVFPQYLLLEAIDGRDAIKQAVNASPMLVLMDLSLPFLSGIEAARQIKALVPETRIVILTIHEEERYRTDALNAGASAYVLKRKMHTDLVPTLSALLNASLFV
jgi:two-component system response regulator NreC